MKKELAESFSMSFHPALVPVYSILFLYVLPLFEIVTLGWQFNFSVLLILVITTIILPIFSLFLLKKQGKISSLYLDKREERTIPYIMSFVYYGITAIMFYRVSFMPIIIPLIPGVASLGCLILALINLKTKVSAHATSMGSLTALIYLLIHFYSLSLSIPLLVVILLSLIVMLSRFYLKAHTLAQLLIGYFGGIFIALFVGYYFLGYITA